MALSQKDNEILSRYGIAQGGVSSSGMPLTITQDEMEMIDSGKAVEEVVGKDRYRKPGLIDRLSRPAEEAGAEFRKRIEGFAEKTENGEQGVAEQVLQTGGALVTGMSKAVGGLGFELAKAIAPKWLEDLADKGVEKVAGSKDVQNIVGEWSKFLNDMSINEPRKTRDLLALLEVGAGIAEIYGAAKVPKAIAEGAVGAVEAGVNTGSRAAGAIAETASPLTSGVKNVVQDSFDRFLGSGRNAKKLESVIQKEATKDITEKIGQTLGEEGQSVTEQAIRSGVTVPQAKLIAELGPDDMSAAKKMVNVADKGADSLRDKHLTRPMIVTGETAVKKMDTIETFMESKGKQIDDLISGNNKTIDLSDKAEDWMESIKKEYGIKTVVDKEGNKSLDFGKSTLVKGDEEIVNDIFNRLQSGEAEDAIDLWKWRQKIARQTGVFKANKAISEGGESIAENFRRMLGTTLDENINGYTQLAREYAPFAKFRTEWETAIGKGFINKGEETLNRRVSELMKTVMNQNGSKWIDLAERMDALAGMAGYKGTDNLINQILTANMIESLWGVQPERVFEKLVGKGVVEGVADMAASVGTGSVRGLSQMLGKVVTNIAGKSKEEQKRLIKKLLQMGDETVVEGAESLVAPTLPKALAADAADLTAGKTAAKEAVVDPLIQEARKYKSADEFVKAQGTPVYRTEKADIVYKGKSVWGDGKYFGIDKNQVKEMTMSPHSRKSTGGTVDEYIIPSRLKIKEIDIGWDAMEPKEFNKFPRGNDLKKQILNDGYDGVILKTDGDLNLGGDQLIMYRNADQIKIKSQLTDIWNKANKK